MKRSGTLQTIFVLALFAGSIAYAVWAEATRSFPALWFIRQQALWDQGRYGVKFTFAVTWFSLLSAVAVPALLIGAAVLYLESRRAPPNVVPPEVAQLVTKSGRKYALWGIAVLLVCVGIAYVCFTMPEVLSPLGPLAKLSLLLLSIGPPLGLFLIFDGWLPAVQYRGPVSQLQIGPDKRHSVTSGQKVFVVSPELYKTLKVGDTIAVLHSALIARLFLFTRTK